MGLKIGIIGKPTKGKSASVVPNESIGIKGLDPKNTVILSFSGKQMPVKGANIMYPRDKKISEGGNFVHLKDVRDVEKIITYISENKSEIKNIVFEDMQYSMSMEFMARAKEKSYDKFTDIGVNFAAWTTALQNARPDLYGWIIWHPEENNAGELKMKTIGAMVDNYLSPEGLLDIILYADCSKGADNKMKYYFITNNDGVFPARSPQGMFEESQVPNDLGFIREKIDEYYN